APQTCLSHGGVRVPTIFGAERLRSLTREPIASPAMEQEERGKGNICVRPDTTGGSTTGGRVHTVNAVVSSSPASLQDDAESTDTPCPSPYRPLRYRRFD
ncbi:unnamed protein product, partial [Mycena citricolor]